MYDSLSIIRYLLLIKSTKINMQFPMMHQLLDSLYSKSCGNVKLRKVGRFV